MIPELISGGAAIASSALTPAASMAAPQTFYGTPTVNVQPVGVNLGAILQPFQQGAPQNGGSGIDYTSRFLNGLTMQDGQVSFTPENKNLDWFLVGTAVLIAGVIIVAKKKRGKI